MKDIKYLTLRPITEILEKKPGATSLFATLFFALLLVAYRSLTINLSICAGAGDCVKYTEMALSFINREYGPIDFPFNLRIMAPWLASIFSQDVAKGFVLLNGASALLFIAFCFEISRLLALRNVEFWILVSWFLLHPLGFGFYSATPQSVDPLTYAFIGLVTVLFISEKRFLLWAAVSLALLAKESFSFIALIIAAAELTYAILTRDKRAIPALASICVAALILFIYKVGGNLIETHLFPQSQEWEITTFSTISWWLNEVWNDPKRLIVWVGATLCSTGLFSIFLFPRKYTRKSPLKTRLDVYFALGGLGFVALGILGGSDMSRIIFNGNLFIILAILISFRNQHLPLKQLLITFTLSMLIALNYTKFFPAAFEYDYYIHGQRIDLTNYYILTTISIMIFLKFIFKALPGNKNIPTDATRDSA